MLVAFIEVNLKRMYPHTQRKHLNVSECYKQQEVYTHQLGHNMAYACNLGMVHALGKYSVCACGII